MRGDVQYCCTASFVHSERCTHGKQHLVTGMKQTSTGAGLRWRAACVPDHDGHAMACVDCHGQRRFEAAVGGRNVPVGPAGGSAACSGSADAASTRGATCPAGAAASGAGGPRASCRDFTDASTRCSAVVNSSNRWSSSAALAFSLSFCLCGANPCRRRRNHRPRGEQPGRRRSACPERGAAPAVFKGDGGASQREENELAHDARGDVDGLLGVQRLHRLRLEPEKAAPQVHLCPVVRPRASNDGIVEELVLAGPALRFPPSAARSGTATPRGVNRRHPSAAAFARCGLHNVQQSCWRWAWKSGAAPARPP